MRVESLFYLQRMGDHVIQGRAEREAAVSVFAPDESPLAGSLIVLTAAPRNIGLWRAFPDPSGGIGPRSRMELLGTTSEITSVGAAAFAVDGALYVTDPRQGLLFRFHPERTSPETAFERVTSLPGQPGPIALGQNGSIFVLADAPEIGTNDTKVFEIPFDEGGSPLAPRPLAELAGTPLSLARDPVSGSLYTLVREKQGDTVLLELSRSWLRRPDRAPAEAFRLSRWRREMETILPGGDTPVLPPLLLPSRLDFARFDAAGGLYFGASDTRVVLKFDLDRPAGTTDHNLGVAAVVEQERGSARKRVRMLAWRKATPGL
jgi:hypothetical protein